MTNSLPTIDPSVPDFGIRANRASIANFVETCGMTETQIADATVDARPGQPTTLYWATEDVLRWGDTETRVPDVVRLHDEADGGHTLSLYPENLRRILREEGETALEERIAEGFGICAELVTLGEDGILEERKQVLKSVYRRAVALRGMAATAVAAAVGGGIAFMAEKFEPQSPGTIVGAVVGLAVLVPSGLQALRGARNRKSLESQRRDAFQGWPYQKRAREQAREHSIQILAGAAEPLITLSLPSGRAG